LTADVYHTAASAPNSYFNLRLVGINTGAPFDNGEFNDNPYDETSFTVPMDQWTRLSLTSVLPAETAYLGIEVTYFSGGALTGYADNVTLTVVPEPSTIVLAALGLIGLVLHRPREGNGPSWAGASGFTRGRG
jgi:hypothetical protein